MNEKPGIALDIDDTLSDTLHHFVGLLNQKFPNPEGLSTEEVIAKYKIVPNMKFWQEGEAKAWLDAEANSNEAQEAIPVLGNALEIVKEINIVVPVRMYITSRPSTVANGSKRWLQKNNFPEAELVTRPHSKTKINGNAWKAEILKEKYPEISGIVDDNPEIIEALGKDYAGTVYLFGNHDTIPEGARTILCPTWDDVKKAVII